MAEGNSSGTGRNLEPTKLGVKSGKSKVNDFGQVNDSDADRSRLSDVGPLSSDTAHYRADTDSGPRSLHHTLGLGRNQAAAGNHSHDGTTGKKLGPLEMDPANLGKTRPAFVLTGSKGGNVALTNLITMLKDYFEFRDTTT